MALSLETFEQKTAEWPPTRTHPTKGIRTGVPTLRLPTVLKLNNNAAGFSLAPPALENRQRFDGLPPDFSAKLRDAIKPPRQIR